MCSDYSIVRFGKAEFAIGRQLRRKSTRYMSRIRIACGAAISNRLETLARVVVLPLS